MIVWASLSILRELSPQKLTTWIINISAHVDLQDMWFQVKRSNFWYFHLFKHDCCSNRILLGIWFLHWQIWRSYIRSWEQTIISAVTFSDYGEWRPQTNTVQCMIFTTVAWLAASINYSGPIERVPFCRVQQSFRSSLVWCQIFCETCIPSQFPVVTI